MDKPSRHKSVGYMCECTEKIFFVKAINKNSKHINLISKHHLGALSSSGVAEVVLHGMVLLVLLKLGANLVVAEWVLFIARIRRAISSNNSV